MSRSLLKRLPQQIHHRNKEMKTELTHLEQYKMLREEIMHHIKEISRLESWGAVAVASVYTWLLLNDKSISRRYLWFIPSCIILICATRCYISTARIYMIAKYLARIEEAEFGKDSHLPGWERYLRRPDSRALSTASFIAAALIWTIIFATSMTVSWFYYHKSPMG